MLHSYRGYQGILSSEIHHNGKKKDLEIYVIRILFF